MAKAAGSSPAANSPQLDVVIDGTWVIVPSVNAAGNIIGIDVYSPACGHPHGAIFVNQINPNPWPAPQAFYMLDNHSLYLAIQRPSGSAGMPVSGIDKTVNQCLPQKRPLGTGWDLMIAIGAGPDAWTSADTVLPQTTDPSSGKTVPCFSGKDAPAGKVSSLQTLSYKGVTGIDFCGAPAALQATLPSPWSGSGSLIFEGEVPYQPTIQHQRLAYDAMAALAGMDIALNYPLPAPPQPPPAGGAKRPMIHTGAPCGFSLIVLPATA